MKRRISAFAAVAVLACFPLASPLQACCDDFWNCAEAAAEKQALLAEARVRFAKDPEVLRKIGIIIEGHPTINGAVGLRGAGERGPQRQAQ